jgi:hypothetical protein
MPALGFGSWEGFYPIRPGLETGVLPKKSGRLGHAPIQPVPGHGAFDLSIAAMLGRLFLGVSFSTILRALQGPVAGGIFGLAGRHLLLLAPAQIVPQGLGQALLPRRGLRFCGRH